MLNVFVGKTVTKKEPKSSGSFTVGHIFFLPWWKLQKGIL